MEFKWGLPGCGGNAAGSLSCLLFLLGALSVGLGGAWGGPGPGGGLGSPPLLAVFFFSGPWAVGLFFSCGLALGGGPGAWAVSWVSLVPRSEDVRTQSSYLPMVILLCCHLRSRWILQHLGRRTSSRPAGPGSKKHLHLCALRARVLVCVCCLSGVLAGVGVVGG